VTEPAAAPPPAPAPAPFESSRAPARKAPAGGLGEFLFRWRGELAIPFLFGVIALARPTALTFLAGLALTALGELVRLSALRHIGPKSRRTRRTGSHGVIRSGPYGWTRNPLYLGNLIEVAGVLVALHQPIALAIGVPLVAIYYRVIVGAEEKSLEVEFGDEYRRYLAEVPRLFPRPPRQPGGPPGYSFGEILLPELNTIVTFELAFALIGALAIWRATRGG
jgi:protein-S-isoprenylcysteine O-methyltransferase Ste14